MIAICKFAIIYFGVNFYQPVMKMHHLPEKISTFTVYIQIHVHVIIHVLYKVLYFLLHQVLQILPVPLCLHTQLQAAFQGNFFDIDFLKIPSLHTIDE